VDAGAYLLSGWDLGVLKWCAKHLGMSGFTECYKRAHTVKMLELPGIGKWKVSRSMTRWLEIVTTAKDHVFISEYKEEDCIKVGGLWFNEVTCEFAEAELACSLGYLLGCLLDYSTRLPTFS
jgi:hypothetical protein